LAFVFKLVHFELSSEAFYGNYEFSDVYDIFTTVVGRNGNDLIEISKDLVEILCVLEHVRFTAFEFPMLRALAFAVPIVSSVVLFVLGFKKDLPYNSIGY